MKARINTQSAIPMLSSATLVGTTVGHSAPPAGTEASAIARTADAATATRTARAPGGEAARGWGVIWVVSGRPTTTQGDRPAGMQGVLHLYAGGWALVDAVDDQRPTPTAERPSGHQTADQATVKPDRSQTGGWS